MAHPQQANFVRGLKLKMPTFFYNAKVLEIGSLDINGSIRSMFQNCEYTGIDLGPGPGVDVVCAGEKYFAIPGSYDVTCSTECFEHASTWFEIFLNMIQLTRSHGLVFFTCATTGRGEHGTARTSPSDSPFTSETNYYRNLTAVDFTNVINLSEYFEHYEFSECFEHHDLYFYGLRK